MIMAFRDTRKNLKPKILIFVGLTFDFVGFQGDYTKMDPKNLTHGLCLTHRTGIEKNN